MLGQREFFTFWLDEHSTFFCGEPSAHEGTGGLRLQGPLVQEMRGVFCYGLRGHWRCTDVRSKNTIRTSHTRTSGVCWSTTLVARLGDVNSDFSPTTIIRHHGIDMNLDSLLTPAPTEPAIEHRVVAEVVPEVVPAPVNDVKPPSNGEETGPSSHHYSTRSKEKKQETITPSQLKQKQHNVIVQPRLKPVPFKQLDLLNKGPVEPQTSLAHEFKINDGEESIKFYQSEDHPFNRRGFKYKPCQPNPKFKSNLYSTTDLPPFKIRPSFFDRSSGINFSENMDYVSTPQGWRSIRTNYGIREGKYYMEFNIVNANNKSDKSHVRIGVARKEASLEAPVGFDGYGYGIRDLNGQKMTLSRPKEFMSLHTDKCGFTTGDVIGFLVDLPSLKDHKAAVNQFVENLKFQIDNTHEIKPSESPKKKHKVKKEASVKPDDDEIKFNKFDNILRDQIPIKYKNALYYEQFEYTTTKQMEHLLNPVIVFGEKAILEEKNNLTHASKNLPIIPNSRIVVYKNGEKIGTMFEDIYSFLPVKFHNDQLNETIYNAKQQQNANYRNSDDGSLGYYPMLSVFLNGIVGLNPGPDFKFPVEEPDLKPLSDRYNESIIEEWLWDLIDEVEAEYLDSYDV